MAIVKIPYEGKTLDAQESIIAYLAGIGIDYERWEPTYPIAPDAPEDEILDAYKPEIDALKVRGGYVTADVIDVNASTPNLEAMLNKFRKEHWHDEDEVRFIIEGRGVFHIHPKEQPVVAIEVGAGDLIRLPRGIWHWFDLCEEKRIRAIRLFQDPAGWTPVYTESGLEQGYLPVCMGQSDIP
ncbi:MAG: acireductone dioxygenase [Nitrospiraceae bacterium]|jgi:1,2-dihydroxy-3-keto-5-methylthiopentene dioxygenase|nr:acireductone dioxygenase [Nitrospiraceae bacterium]|tara:strand:- start:968 stop:1516 length:549 start_codon:yes stop_codon:yes gene_type:complete